MKKLTIFISVFALLFIVGCKKKENLKIVERHSNGEKKIVFHYDSPTEKKKLVKKTEYNEKGQVMSILNLIDNTEKKISYYLSGEKWLERNFQNGKRNGKWIKWSIKGKKVGKGNYKKGSGKWIEWYENGNKKLEAHHKDGKEHGKALIWYKDGSKRCEFNYIEGKRNGRCIEWDSKGYITLEEIYKEGKLLQKIK